MDRTSHSVQHPPLMPLAQWPCNRLTCPSCGATLADVTAHGIIPAQGGFYLNDGDLVNLPEQVESDQDCSMLTSLMIGTCKACEAHYYQVEAHVMQSSPDNVMRYFTGEGEATHAGYYMLSEEEGGSGGFTWRVCTQSTPDGPLQIHEIGPITLSNAADVMGAHGVSPCQGRGSAAPWQFAAHTVEHLRPTFYEIIRVTAAKDARQQG